MAFMNGAKKAKIAAALSKVVPVGWKYSLAVRNHSTIVMTIRVAPVDLIGAYTEGYEEGKERPTHVSVNPYHFEDYFKEPLKSVFKKIFAALNLDNHDNSDVMTDYFDVGHYVAVEIGRWDAPFLDTVPPPAKVKGYVKVGLKAGVKQKFPLKYYEKFLPDGWDTMSPGKKAAATKKAIQASIIAFNDEKAD